MFLQRGSAGPPAPNSFLLLYSGIILPKASIITGILANIYLVLILLGLREIRVSSTPIIRM